MIWIDEAREFSGRSLVRALRDLEKQINVPSCRAIRQGDEVYCPVAGCGLRWSLDEDRPECPFCATRTLDIAADLRRVTTK